MKKTNPHFLKTLVVSVSAFMLLVGCDVTDKLEESCEAGDETACEILGTISEAIEELEDAVPTDLVLSSAFEDATGYGTSDKQARLSESLDPAVIERDGLVACLRALPPPPPVRDPTCYGPRMDYVNHPSDGTSGGQLPSGDLGIWLATEPTQNDAGSAPCAAEKMNELVSKAIHNIDMATGSVAMMMCAAAHEKISSPKNNADVLDFSAILGKVPNSPFTITTATLERIDANTLKTVFSATHDAGNNNRMGQMTISTTHNNATKSGLVQIERTPQNSDRKVVTSARYQPDSTNAAVLKLRVHQGRFLTSSNTTFYDSEGDVKLGPITGNPNRNIEDTHIFLAEFNPTENSQIIAYGWNAGGNDSHYRVFNAEAAATTADAWYGFVPNPYEANGSTSIGESPDLDLSAASAGMICNWAGPGNSHTPSAYLQHQYMTIDGADKWSVTAANSLIKYVPTNNCELTTNSSSSTFSVVVPQGRHTASFQVNDIGSSDTFTQNASATIGMNAKSNHNVTLPDSSW